MHKKGALFMVVAVFLTLLPITAYSNTDASSNPSGYTTILKELTQEKYKGRQTGTKGYIQSIQFLENQLKASGVVPLLKSGSYRQEYGTKTATLKSESFKVNGNKYEIMKDYMPFSRCTSGSFTFNELYYSGSGQAEDYTGNLGNSVAVFRWKNKTGVHGALDRILIAKDKGASAVFIIAEDDAAVGNYEYPLNGNDVGIPAVYVSKEFARNVLNVPIDSYEPQKLPDKKIEMSFDISRKTATGINLLGVIPGKQEEKAILVTTNIDGFGSLPDGRVYQNAKNGTAPAAMLIDLARYYTKEKPDYTIILAFAGGKWTGNSGIEQIINAIDFTNIALSVDLYAMGGDGKPNIFYMDNAYAQLAENIKGKTQAWTGYMQDDFGNALTSSLIKKTKKLLFIRDNNTWIDNSFDDTFNNITSDGYNKGINFLKILIDEIARFDKAALPSFNYASPNEGKEQVPEINREVRFKESKYFKVFSDEVFQKDIDSYYLKEIDNIYDRIMKYNYYPAIESKIKIFNLESGDERAMVVGKQFLVGKNEQGGCQSLLKMAIACKQASLTTVAHEINHLIADAKGYGNGDSYKNSIAQESQGKGFLVCYDNSRKNVYDASTLINEYLQNHEAAGVLNIAKNYKTAMDWKGYFTSGMDKNVTDYQNRYNLLGSIYCYLKYNFGPDTARRAMYRVYDLKNNPAVEEYKNTLSLDTGLSTDDFLDSWSLWMASSGSDTGEKAKKASAGYKDNLTQFDYQKIYIDKNAIDDLSFNGNIVFNAKAISSKDLKVYSFKAERVEDNIVFTLDCESGEVRNYFLFNPPTGDKIGIRGKDAILKGRNVIKMSIPVTTLKTVNTLTLNLYTNINNFMAFDVKQLNGLLMGNYLSGSKLYNIDVKLDGKLLEFDVPPISINGRTLVPVRKIFEALDAVVNWDASTQTITGTKGNTKIVLKLESKDALVNGKHITLDVPATSKNGRTLVPARFISESLDALVEWNSSTNTVVITSE